MVPVDFVAMERDGRAQRRVALRFERHHCGEEAARRGSIAGDERVGPHQSAIGHHFEIATRERVLDAIRLAGHEPKHAAGTQVDLALRNHTRCRCIPSTQMIGFRPGGPGALRRDTNDTLDHEVKLRVELATL